MKKILLSLLISLIATTSFAQVQSGDNVYFNFDDYINPHLTIDFASNQNNVWQIGKPQKIVFNNAFSPPNVIVTDTMNPYPTNDTSIFIIKNTVVNWFGGWGMAVRMGGLYQINSDTLKDFGRIEFSPNNGNIWIDLLKDTLYSSHYAWNTPKPDLTGNSNGWKYFNIDLTQLQWDFNIQTGDTVLYRFTFISDSIQTNKDGLMFDNLIFEDLFEGIQEIQNDNLILVYPNPTTDYLIIQRTKTGYKQTVQILNYTGQVLFENQNFAGETIDTRQLKNGVYLLSYSDTKSFSIKKFIVNH